MLYYFITDYLLFLKKIELSLFKRIYAKNFYYYLLKLKGDDFFLLLNSHSKLTANKEGTFYYFLLR